MSAIDRRSFAKTLALGACAAAIPAGAATDSSITDGIEVETKTEGGNANVWLPDIHRYGA